MVIMVVFLGLKDFKKGKCFKWFFSLLKLLWFFDFFMIELFLFKLMLLVVGVFFWGFSLNWYLWIGVYWSMIIDIVMIVYVRMVLMDINFIKVFILKRRVIRVEMNLK